MADARYRIEVFHRFSDPRCEVVRKKIAALGFNLRGLDMSDNYLIDIDTDPEGIQRVARLLVQPVIQDALVNEPYLPGRFDYAVEIGFLPGVTDNVAHTVRESIEDLMKREIDIERSVFSSITYFLTGDLSGEIVGEFYNPLIQRMKVRSYVEYRERGGMGREMPLVTIAGRPDANEVSLDVSDDELVLMGREGIADGDGTRRGPLALDMLSMGAIRDYFLNMEKRNPTDIELESIAQTWSEHCKHTIFAAALDDDLPEGIFRTYIRDATVRIRREKGEGDFCVSVFVDNSGGIEFNEEFIISDKVETHNSPSALDPFGGAITGIVGVNRDAIGFGMGARPVANRYGFCFADPFDDRPLYRNAEPSSRMLSPRRIMEGVVHGVNAGGNTSGIPTPQGFVYFDERYKGKPLVFVGTVGLMPKTVCGMPSCEKRAMPGDNIVMIGGRVGRDGIHGATFSSEALSSGSPATAVQIGDPITQKKLSDAIVREARDRGLYHSITDNGAGGLSCSVAEMARECGGFEVDLDRVPLKYPGLDPWQVWLSESQERMTLSVPDETLDAFIDLMKRRGVEATVIGRFTGGSRGVVRHGGRNIFDMDMGFLHDGLPKKRLETSYTKPSHPVPRFDEPGDMTPDFVAMTGRLNTASFEFISTQYDHEVQGGSVIKPLQGRGRVNGNATVIRPLLDSWRGAVLSQGIYPSYSDIDAYWMAACSIDTAVRNAVAAGGSLDRMAILDNFCWCDSTNPERLGQLREAARACYDIAVAYGTPFISGKDSMFNDFRGYDEEFREVRISIPPTLLISSIGVVEDIRKCQTIDFKVPGDLVYCLGTTGEETGGSEYLAYMGEKITGKRYIGNAVPRVDAEEFKKTYRALEKAIREGLVASCISVERGGLALALAKAAMSGMTGIEIDLSALDGRADRDDYLLFSESQGRVVVSVAPENRAAFEDTLAGVPLSCLGTVSQGTDVVIMGREGTAIVRTGVTSLLEEYRGLFRDF